MSHFAQVGNEAGSAKCHDKNVTYKGSCLLDTVISNFGLHADITLLNVGANYMVTTVNKKNDIILLHLVDQN